MVCASFVVCCTGEYFVLQSLHKPLPSTTLYCKACAKHTTTFYYKACTKYSPVQHTTKLAQTTSQYYFVLQSLRKALPSTSLYRKACTHEYRCTYEVPSIAGCNNFTRKNVRFRAPASSPAQVPCNIHAAITMCFAAPRTHQCSHYCTLRFASQRRRTPRRSRLTSKRSKPQPPHTHTRYPSSPPAATLQRKTARFCAPASRPKPAPCNSHAAITVCFAAPRTHPCTKGGNRLTSKRSKPQPPQTQGTLHRRLQPLHTEKRTVSCRLPPQNQPHATVMQPLQCVSQHHVSNPHVLTHMATKRDNNHAAIARRSASTDCKTPCN